MTNPFIPLLNSYLPEPHASLLNGILFGTKSSMPISFYNSLVSTGTLHIIALSGMNISILINMIAKITIGIGKKWSVLATLAVITLFVLFVGPSPSVVRAAIMGSLSLLAVFFGRQNWGLLSLFLAGGAMLLYDLSLIGNISFQLSFLATLGIILATGKRECQKKRSRLQQFIYYFRENLKLTVAAQIFTLPVIFHHFHRISLISPLANLLIGWSIQYLMILGFAAGLAGFLFWPVGWVLSWTVWVLLEYVIVVIEILARIPGASVTF